MDVFFQADKLIWQDVPKQAVKLAEECDPVADVVRRDLHSLPWTELVSLSYNPEKQAFDLQTTVDHHATREPREKLAEVLAPHGQVVEEATDGPWVPFILIPHHDKQASSKLLENIRSGLLMGDSAVADWIPGAPSPLAGTIAGGMLGAGLGYGAGWLGEKLMPEKWQKGRLSKTLALAGGAAGTVPGLGLMYGYHKSGLNPWDAGIMSEKGASYSGFAGPSVQGQMQTIPVYEFNQDIYTDPRISNRLSGAQQAALSGVVTGAAHQSGHGTNFITPLDVGRMTLGMGSGYVSGALVGKALGTMMGMPPQTQEKLKSTGMWAGALANLVPTLFRR